MENRDQKNFGAKTKTCPESPFVSGGAVWISARLAPDYRRRVAAGLAPDQTRADARLRPQTRPVDAGRGLQRRTEGEIWGAGFRIQFSCRLALVYVYSVKK